MYTASIFVCSSCVLRLLMRRGQHGGEARHPHVPCRGHLVACNHCGKKLTKCPICRQQVVKVHKVDLVSELDLAKLTKKEFKKMLKLCGVQFETGVTARRMLLLQGGEILERDPKCKVCLENNIDSVFLPCGHMMTCIQCGSKLVNCPICPNMPTLAMVNKIYRA